MNNFIVVKDSSDCIYKDPLGSLGKCDKSILIQKPTPARTLMHGFSHCHNSPCSCGYYKFPKCCLCTFHVFFLIISTSALQLIVVLPQNDKQERCPNLMRDLTQMSSWDCLLSASYKSVFKIFQHFNTQALQS